MKTLYLDVCTLCRPFDDKNQLRIQLETDAMFLILRRIETGFYRAVVSPVHHSEISEIRETSERLEIKSLWSAWTTLANVILSKLTHRAEGLIDMGFGIADAAHVAFAEQLAEVFITFDDKLLKRYILPAATFAENERGIMPKFKHKI